jgi:2,3-bisphosphoglycerate-dependent phosphoglycerate mutase
MTHLYLIRHGESVANVTPIVAGMKGDVGLTERGVAQAERLRERLAQGEIAADVLIASTLPRARQTAEIIAPALGLPIIFDDTVQELDIGEADGLTTTQAWAKYGMPDFEQFPLRPIAPGGDSWGSFMLRVGNAFARITAEHAGKTIVVVCHGGVIDGSFVYFMGMPTLQLPQIDFSTHNTSITHWHHHNRDGTPIWKLERYNDIAHLTGLGAFDSVRWRDTEVGPQADSHPAVPVPTEE